MEANRSKYSFKLKLKLTKYKIKRINDLWKEIIIIKQKNKFLFFLMLNWKYQKSIAYTLPGIPCLNIYNIRNATNKTILVYTVKCK